MADDKEINITLTVRGSGGYTIAVGSDTVEEQTFDEDTVAGVKGRLTAIGDNLSQYIPAEESRDGEGADPSPKPEPEDEKPE